MHDSNFLCRKGKAIFERHHNESAEFYQSAIIELNFVHMIAAKIMQCPNASSLYNYIRTVQLIKVGGYWVPVGGARCGQLIIVT